MRIGIAQMETAAGALAQTLERMGEYARLAAKREVDLLVFPMAALCGPTAVQHADREGFLLDLIEEVSPFVEKAACPCLLPVLVPTDGPGFPEALLIDGDEVTPVRLSAQLAPGGDARQEAPEAEALPEVAFRGARLGVAFTYDDLDAYDDFEYDVDVVVFLSGYGFATDDPSSALGASLREGRFLSDAEATGAWIVGVGSLGCYDTQVFVGSSFVLSPWGELAAQAPSFEESLLVCDVDPSAEGPLPEPVPVEVYDGPLVTWGALTMGLSSLVSGAGCSGACLVATDSLPDMLLAVLAVDSFGPMGVHLVVPRVEGEKSRSVEELVRSLRIPEENVEEVVLPSAAEAEVHDAAVLRLAELSRRLGLAALGSRDKTGWALEPSRGVVVAAAIEPFADLYRSEVLELARMRSMISPVIPQRCLSRLSVPDLPGIDPAASIEETLESVDLMLASYLEWERPLSDIVAERGRAKEGLAFAVIDRLRTLEATRGSRPLAPTLSSRTLDEARGPIGLAWRDRVRESSERMEARIGELVSASEESGEGGEPPRPGPALPSDGEIRDILGYLRDFSLGGAFSGLGGDARPTTGGRHQDGGMPQNGLWEGPFSEN